MYKSNIFLFFIFVFQSLRILIYTGKGGTGKTVNSCSTAIRLADLGKKTLIISADPAHTLNDAFMVNIIGNDTKKILNNLYAMQVDPVIELDKNFNSILSYNASLFFSNGLDEIIAYEMSMLPGMTQLFSLMKIQESAHHDDYEVIVLDMPASGEALRYLYLPKLVGSIGRKLTKYTGIFSGFAKMFETFPGFRSNAPYNVINDEIQLITKLEDLSKLIIDPTITSLRLVANPDTFSIENAKRSLMSANLYGINVDLVLVNKIMPNSNDMYFSNWSIFQNNKVKDAKNNFYPLPIKEIMLYEKELRGIDMLRKNALSIFGDDDPSKIFYSERVFEFVKEDPLLKLKLKVPFTIGDDFYLDRSSENLIIKVKGSVGYIVNVIPLPSMTIGMKIIRSELINNELQIFFEKK